MPIYPYVCSACGHEFDMLQKVSDNPLSQCPQCGEGSLRKKLTAAAFHLKGTGWYETDFKNKGKKKDQKEEQKSDQKEGGKEDSKKTDGKRDDSKSKDTKSGDKTTASTSDKSTKSESKKADSN